MGSNYPPDFYDEEAVAALSQAYREIWKTVVMNDPFRDPGKDEKLGQRIIQTVMELAADGIFKVDELRDRTLAKVLSRYEVSIRRGRPRYRSPRATQQHRGHYAI